MTYYAPSVDIHRGDPNYDFADPPEDAVILVTGWRGWTYGPDDFAAYEMLGDAMRSVLGPLGAWDFGLEIPLGNVEVLVGDCPTGMDDIARRWCRANLVACQVYETDLRRYPPIRRAIARRNAQMVAANPTHCLGFPKPGLQPGEPSGTIDCMNQADAAGIPNLNCTPIKEEV